MYVLLAGMSPFPTSDKESLIQAVTSATYEYPAKYWDVISAGAKDLIDHMLVLNQNDRFTIEHVLMHPWLNASNDPDSDSIE